MVAATFPPLREPRVFERVVDHLRSALLDGRLRQGDRLPAERELVRQFQVGRGAVREALRVLEQGGLVRIRPGNGGGAFVNVRSSEAVTRSLADMIRFGDFTLDQITQVRLGLESLIVDTLATSSARSELLRLSQWIDDTRTVFSAGQAVQRTEANVDFHVRLAQATGNPVYPLLIRALLDILEPILIRSGGSRRLSLATFASHEAIVRGLLAGDTKSAKRELNAHLLDVERRLHATSRRRRRA